MSGELYGRSACQRTGTTVRDVALRISEYMVLFGMFLKPRLSRVPVSLRFMMMTRYFSRLTGTVAVGLPTVFRPIS